MKRVHTEEAPAPAGHYSQAIVHGGLVFVSGQLPIGPDGKPMADAPVEEQTRVVLANVGRILDAADSGLERVVQVTIYVSDIDHWPAVNETYAEVFGEHRPARAVVPVPALHHGVALEVQTIAALR